MISYINENFFLLGMSLLKFLSKSKSETLEQSVQLEGTIQGAIIDRIRDIESYLKYVATIEGVNYKEIKLTGIKPEFNYNNLDFAPYKTVLFDVGASIDFLQDTCMVQKETLKTYEALNIKHAKHMETWCNERGFIYKIGDDSILFEKKNKNRLNYISASSKLKNAFKQSIDATIKSKNANADWKKELGHIMSTLLNVEIVSADLMKDFMFIENLQQKENSNMTLDVMNDLLVDMLYGDINRSRVLKELAKLERIKIIEEPTFVSKIDVLCSQKSQQTTPETKKQMQFDVDFFHGRGINGVILKQICADEKKYFSAKNFILGVETLLSEVGIEKKWANSIVQNESKLLLESKQMMNEYLNELGQLYDIIDPNIVSGIHPTNNIELYRSKENINALVLKEKSKIKKVNIQNVEEVFTNDKDKETFITKVSSNPFDGELIQKYLSRKTNKKTIFYEKYSEVAGEGLYIKRKFGSRRAVYKLDRINDEFNVQVITYFDTHDAHVRYFMKK